MHLDQLPGAHRTPHARSGQGPCQNRKRHRGRAPKSMKGRDHISVIGSLGDAHWSPSPGSARYTHVRRRRTRLNLLPSSADGRGDVDSTYPPWSPRSRLRRRGLSAPSSRFFSGRAKKVLQTMSARFSQSNMCTGRMNLVWLTSPIFDEGKLRSTPLLSHSGHTDMAGSAARMPTSGYSVIVSARATDCSRECLCHRSMV